MMIMCSFHISVRNIFLPFGLWMDGMARLSDEFRQVPETTGYLDKSLFIVVMHMSVATALSPSDST